MKKGLFLFFVLSTLLSAFGIKKPSVSPGPEEKSVIVVFSEPVSEAALYELSAGKFKSIKPLNVAKTQFVFTYSPGATLEYSAIESIRNLPYYAMYQEDFAIAMRTSPDDSLFGSQWHLPLIHATEAWNMTRRGVNGNGDTIVIAVIDDGLHINHPDFKGNIWINYADTAGNGLDDDGNGYIDDHFGWNFMGNNNDISDSNYYKAGHGTPVAGIIGAKGNDKTGICGIMWNVKLMVVNFTDTGRFPQVFQSDVIKAYNYVLQQKKLYLATQGKQGAYVVATNASWGIDGKFPHQAPLWCSLYDTLGKYGIMNLSAVSNNPQNQVDSDGDLPTLCPSPHLITVASTTSGDNYFSSGYSTVSVDLSAPGANIFSTSAYTKDNIQKSRMYLSSFSGTSFATPMVTAAVGILHSYACARVLDSMRVNPVKGNAMIRKFILEGVDVIPGLSGKNASSGRLNIQKSMEIMDQYCFGYVGINTNTDLPALFLFPNPGNGLLEIESEYEVTEVSCTDYCGRSIPVHYLNSTIDISDLPDGVYMFRIRTTQGEQSIKYIKTSSF